MTDSEFNENLVKYEVSGGGDMGGWAFGESLSYNGFKVMDNYGSGGGREPAPLIMLKIEY